MRVWHMLKNGWRVIRWSTTYEHVLNNVIKNEFAGPLNMKIYNNIRVIAGHLLKKKIKKTLSLADNIWTCTNICVIAGPRHKHLLTFLNAWGREQTAYSTGWTWWNKRRGTTERRDNLQAHKLCRCRTKQWHWVIRQRQSLTPNRRKAKVRRWERRPTIYTVRSINPQRLK